MSEPFDDADAETPSAAAVQVLVANHRAFLRFVERRVGSRDIAEDILQEAFGRAIDRIETVRADESIVAWFYRLLRNAVIDHYRRNDVSSRALESFATELETVVPATDARDEICACVGKLASGLKPEYAEALQRVEVEGTPVKAFAEERGITPNNAAVRLFRAREALRRQVVASCGTCAEHGCVDCSCRTSKRQ
jgi:RNA polymerase sigma-70 factor (ECF subfamily)